MANHYGLTLADVDSLKLWEMNYLIEEMSEEQKKTKRPPGAVPVMT